MREFWSFYVTLIYVYFKEVNKSFILKEKDHFINVLYNFLFTLQHRNQYSKYFSQFRVS